MHKSVICTTYFSQKIHPNDPTDAYVSGRTQDGRVIQNDIKYIEPWYNSVNKLGLNGIVFYDNLTEEFVQKYQTDKINFIKVNPSIYSNNDWRFFVYRDYFETHEYDSVFLTDGSDVTVVNDPSLIIKEFDNINIFVCKDSIKLKDFPYLSLHNQVGWDGRIYFTRNNNHFDLINMGVIGGSYKNIIDFLDKFCITRIELGNPDFNSDMWLGQYIFRYLMQDSSLMVGEPFTSNFKQYENDRKDVYFIHK